MDETRKKKLVKILEMKKDPIVTTLNEIERVDSAIQEIQNDSQKIVEAINELDQTKATKRELEIAIEGVQTIVGPRGFKGEKGADGKDGKDGLNGKDGKDGLNGIDGKDGKDGVDGIDGKDGKDGSPDTPDQVIEKIHKSKKLIKKEKIEGLEDIERKADFALNRPLIQGVGGGSSGIREIRAGKNIGVSNINEVVTVRTIDSPEFDTVLFDTTYTPTGTEPKGTIFWDEPNKTFSGALGGDVVGQFFEEALFPVQNDTGSTLLNGKVATYASSIGNSGNIRVELTVASEDEEPMYTIGIVTADILDGAVGKVTTRGKVRGIQTNGANYGETWVDGDILYKSSTIAGGLTKNPPEAPIPAIPLAIVISAHATNGTLMVRPVMPTSMKMLSDVDGTPLETSGQIMVWDNDRKVFDFNYNINDIGSGEDGIGFDIDGFGIVPSTTVIGSYVAKKSGNITGWKIIESNGVSSSIVLTVKKNGTEISGTEKPTLSNASSAEDTELTTWTTSIAKGDIISISIDSVSVGTKFFLQIYYS